MNHRSVNRRSTQNSLRPAGRPDGAGFSMNNQESKSESKRPFLEDFNMEHCCSGVTAALRTFAASSDSAEPATSRNAYAHPKNPPTCVYLG